MAREQLVEALNVDLVGPFQDDELLALPPSRWYLTGFLAPEGGVREMDPTSDEEYPAGSDEDEEEGSGAEPEAKQRKRLPASMGLSVLVPDGVSSLQAVVSWADYVAEDVTEDGRKRVCWRRQGRDPVSVKLRLDADLLANGVLVPGGGMWNPLGLRVLHAGRRTGRASFPDR